MSLEFSITVVEMSANAPSEAEPYWVLPGVHPALATMVWNFSEKITSRAFLASSGFCAFDASEMEEPPAKVCPTLPSLTPGIGMTPTFPASHSSLSIFLATEPVPTRMPTLFSLKYFWKLFCEAEESIAYAVPSLKIF